MRHRGLLGALASAVLAALIGRAAAWDDAKYPDLQGHWARFSVGRLPGQPSFDQTKPWGAGQQAPLTPEYRAIFEASLADQAKGGEGNYVSHARCLAAGMPHMMVAFRPLEFVVTPNTTYILIADVDHYRRIFTDGRDWPKEIEPTYQGYSIGRWIDEDGDGACLKSRRVASRARVPTTPLAFRCISTTSPYSRSASISTGPIPT